MLDWLTYFDDKYGITVVNYDYAGVWCTKCEEIVISEDGNYPLTIPKMLAAVVEHSLGKSCKNV